MDTALFASCVSLLGFALATTLIGRHVVRGGPYRSAKRALFGASALYAFVALSNVLEHAGITDMLDPVEDALEIVFLLVFLFFVHCWQSERALTDVRTQSAWLAATFNAIGAGVLTTLADGRVYTLNPEMARLLGKPEGELLRQPIDAVLALEFADARSGPIANPVRRAIETGRTVTVVEGSQIIVPFGTPIPISGSVSPMLDENAVVRGAVAVLRDESLHTRMKEQLVHARKMDALGQLAGGIAHDFNNMLGGILGAADLLVERVAQPPHADDARLVGIIIEAAENAAALTSKLLTFGRKARLTVAPFEVNELVKQTLDIADRAIDKRVRIERVFASEPLVVSGDASQIKSAVLNLLLNARDALRDDGLITVTVRLEALEPEWCETSPFAVAPGAYARISIRDDGTGIAPSVLSRIFEPFFTTKAEGKGTGLGLASVFGAVETHHGAITVYSELGTGTVFDVYLPLSDLGASTVLPPTVAASAPCTGGVLVVDDESVIRATVELMLANSGYTIFVADTGARALELARANRDAIDVLLLDVVMPDVSGFALAETLREILPDVPIVFASGFVRNNERGPAGARFIDKPFRRARLIEVLREAVEHGGARKSTESSAPLPTS